MSKPFDFEAFISGSHLPTIEVPLYRVDHSLRIAQLDIQIKALPEEPGDEREGVQSEREALVAERDALMQEQVDSTVLFELRALNSQEYASVGGASVDAFDQIALQSQGTRNEAPREVWERVSASVSAMQWGMFVGHANDLILSRVVVPDFSPTTSKTPPPSSEN